MSSFSTQRVSNELNLRWFSHGHGCSLGMFACSHVEDVVPSWKSFMRGFMDQFPLAFRTKRYFQHALCGEGCKGGNGARFRPLVGTIVYQLAVAPVLRAHRRPSDCSSRPSAVRCFRNARVNVTLSRVPPHVPQLCTCRGEGKGGIRIVRTKTVAFHGCVSVRIVPFPPRKGRARPRPESSSIHAIFGHSTPSILPSLFRFRRKGQRIPQRNSPGGWGPWISPPPGFGGSRVVSVHLPPIFFGLVVEWIPFQWVPTMGCESTNKRGRSTSVASHIHPEQATRRAKDTRTRVLLCLFVSAARPCVAHQRHATSCDIHHRRRNAFPRGKEGTGEAMKMQVEENAKKTAKKPWMEGVTRDKETKENQKREE